MGLYSDFLFPWCVDKFMSDPAFNRIRQRLLAPVDGNVLEIGFGTGLNLPYYPKQINKLSTIDSNSAMRKWAQKRIDESSLELEHYVLSGEALPMEDDSFDCIISTWTLCSIERVDLALGEIHRLLKPHGRFYFVEHGLSPDPRIQKWQYKLNPIQKLVGCGCRLDRNMREIIRQQGFQLDELSEYYFEDAPKTHGYMYEGVARTVAKECPD